jgi:hypothetical protein
MSIERASGDFDPERCQGITSFGPCPNKGTLLQDGTRSKYCLVHGGAVALKAEANALKAGYRLEKWNLKIQEFANAPALKSLRDEICILRMTLENELNMLDDEHALMMRSGTVSNLIAQITNTVKQCDALETKMGMYLDKGAILQFVNALITLLEDEIKDPDILASLSEKIPTLLDSIVPVQE